MPRLLVRSLVSLVVAACFAFVASTGGAMLGCPTPGATADHAQHGTPGHPDGHHGTPDGRQACVVHVCCAHLDAPSPAALGSEHAVALQVPAGRMPPAVLTSRIPHALPFAQGPPAHLA